MIWHRSFQVLIISTFFLTTLSYGSFEDLSDLNSVALLANIIGMTSYSRYFGKFDSKRLLLFCQTVLWLVSLSVLGVASGVVKGFAVGKFVFGLHYAGNSMVAELTLMPILLISSSVSQKGSEATVMSLFLAINTFSYNVGTFFGIFLTWMFGVSQTDMTGFNKALIVQNSCLFLSVLLVAVFGFPHAAKIE